jgi:AcrR family transcriptional regulator
MEKSPTHDELPPPLDLLWGGEARAARGRRPGLSLERVVHAALELAEMSGLETVTMSRVAERLGFTTMALYRHVRSKDELVALMVESAVGAPPEPAAAAAPGWRAQLERWAWDLLAVLRRHPWALSVPLAALPFGPSRAAWLDRGLRGFADTALDEDEKAALVLLVNNYVFSEMRLTQQLVDAGDEGGADGVAVPEHGAQLSALVDSERFPALRRALDAGIFDPPASDRDADFAFGLERILDGIELLVEERATLKESR